MNEALAIGIKSPDTYYTEGKIKGKTSRDSGVMGHKNLGNETKGRAVVSDKAEVSYDITDESRHDNLLKKPMLIGIPQLIVKIRMLKAPKFLDGFKHFNRK